MIRRRFFKATWALVLLLAIGGLGGDTLGAGSVPEQAARAHLFNIYTWHLENFPVRWPHTVRRALSLGPDPAGSVSEIQQYFDLNREVNALKRKMERLDAATNGEQRDQTERQLEDLTEQRDRLKYSVERALEDMLSEELIDQGLTRQILAADTLWPPVYFRLSDMPSILVVSPRDQVRIMETHLLRPDMTLKEIEDLERSIDERGLSSLVLEIGGVATYPSLVPDTVSLDQLLDVAAHEWVHQYLYFKPLGQRYWESGDMTVINETVADLVGRELGSDVYERYFTAADTQVVRASSPAPRAAAAPLPATFDFNSTMRETRQTLDTFLRQGKVKEAESYLEERRRLMVSQGYHIRKLNQAYFAFHGNYAERPGSINPIGGWVRTIRDDSPDIKTFLERVAQYTSLNDLKMDVWNTQQKILPPATSPA